MRRFGKPVKYGQDDRVPLDGGKPVTKSTVMCDRMQLGTGNGDDLPASDGKLYCRNRWNSVPRAPGWQDNLESCPHSNTWDRTAMDM